MIAGRYTLEREIGRGGMGAVFLGVDEVLGREVALKRIGMMPGGTAPDLARAEREARLAARLNHPHVVAVYDLVTEGDEQWLVMEYVEGTTLAELVRREGALSPDRAAAIVVQAADALAAAHAAGIVHRDVKPSNILVAPDGQVKLSDFGIARAEADASLTQTGLVTGSPAYLSPEVASGQSATDASDVWSLGATLFHALAGQPPYEVGGNLLGALYRIVHEDPPRLPDAGWLAPVLAATMTREPADRWSMAHVRDVLAAGPAGVGTVPAHRAVGGDGDVTRTRVLPPPAPVAAPAATTRAAPPVPPAPPTPPATSAPDRRRRGWWPLLAVAAVVVVVALIAWLALSGGGDQPDRSARRAAGGHTSAPQTSSSPSSPSTSPPASPGVTPEGMTSFIESYLSTVTSDPATAWDELTPAFQAQSGGFGQYQKFWRQFDGAALLDARPDPRTRQISYTVRYDRSDGKKMTDHVTLQLAGADGAYKIAGES